MTREDAIKIFNELLLFGKAPCKKEELEDLCKIVLAALEQEPTTKNDLGVDAVSRKAVINQIFYSTDNNGDVVLGSALRERIARLPSVTPQLSSELEKNSKKLEKDFGELDCISRADAIGCLAGQIELSPSNVASVHEYLKCVDKRLHDLPSVTPQEPRKGHWTYIRNSEINGLKIVECSECGKRSYGSGNYCPNCGAKMADSEGKE